MIHSLKYFEGHGVDPHYNLAVEQMLLETMKENECILYLWQNDHTVVIGRNQNARKECRLEKMEEDHIRLARRISGGGAVYHDLGNLNFTFLMNTEDFDIRKQAEVILAACRAAGVHAEISGRNDITVDGRKISGNAFYHHLGRSFHHGTLLVDTDLGAMERYLRPSEEKIRAKGVDSVHARVVNLSSVVPSVTVALLKKTVLEAFADVYGQPPLLFAAEDFDEEILNRLYERNRSTEWNFGLEKPYHYLFEKRFAWGEVRIELYLENGFIRRCSVWTDAMDPTLSKDLEEILTGCRFDRFAMSGRIGRLCRPEADDLGRAMLEEEWK